MLESKYQRKLIKKFEKEGYYVLRLIKTNKNGIPDLLALKDGEKPIFIEVKAKKGVVSTLQEFRISELRKLGFTAYIDRDDS